MEEVIKLIEDEIENDKIFKQRKINVEDTINDLKNILRVYFKFELKRSIGKVDDYNCRY